MHAQQQARALGDGFAIIVDAGAVGGAHFAQHRARARHDIGDAEAVADLDQLAARDDHFAAGGQFVQRQKNRGGVVVDGDCRARPAAARAAPPTWTSRLPRRPRGEIVFEIGVAGENGASGASGARPRLVCSTTPVALMTRRSDGAASAAQRARDARFDG